MIGSVAAIGRQPGFGAGLFSFRRRRRRLGWFGAVSPAELLGRSISRDPQLLFRLPRAQARRLADTVIAGASGANTLLLDAARRFAAFDAQRPEIETGEVAVRSAAVAADRPSLLELALEPTAAPRLLFAAATALDVSGFAALPHPTRRRVAERAVRAVGAVGRVGWTARGGDDPRPTLRLIDAALRSGLPFPLVPVPAGGTAERVASAIRDWRDLSVCAALLGVARHPAWTVSRDTAAFAALWRCPGVRTLLPPREADCLGADAARAARTVLREGGPCERDAARTVLNDAGDPGSERPAPRRGV